MEAENKTPTNDKNIKVLRTYSSDMADAIRTNEVSVIKIALAEKEKKEREEMNQKAEGTNTSKTLLVIGGIILIAVAIIGSYFLLQKKKEKEIPEPIISNIDTFISYDSNLYIDVTNVINSSELSEILKKEQTANSGLIKALFLTKKITDKSELLTSRNFLSLIGATAPGALVRSLSDKYLLGKYADKNIPGLSNETALFLIFQTTDYNQAYASMLEWEKTMLKDLFILFDIKITDTSEAVFDKPWQDIIINNRDARVLYGENDSALLYYVFVNKNNFIITNNIRAVKEIIARLIIKNTKPL
ncbi:MAG: hypothetical protein WC603_01240 [Candidatus Paceibacterota bacterium]|jgi:hypothetical protein